MNSGEGGSQGNNKYDFGFDDEDDNQNDQVNNNFYQEENGNNNFNNINQFNNINYNNMNNNFINNQNNNFNQFQNNQSQFNNNNYNFNNQNNNQFAFNQNNYNMNNNNNNNYNNNMNNMNQNQPNQFQNFPNNQNINYQNNNYQNVPYQQQNMQNMNKNMQEQKPKNPDKEKLKNAYNLFMQGIMDCKKYNYEIGLDKFEKVKATIEEVYPKIEKDEKMKKTTDDFLKQVNKNIDITEKRIKQKYNYVPAYNYAGVDAKQEVARFLKETELAAQERKKKLTNIITSIKKKPKDSPSYYMNDNNNNYDNNVNGNNNNNINNNQKKDDQKIITNDLRDKVLSEIVERKPDVKFTDVIGLKEAKEILREIIIVPNLRPDLFKGLRSPPRGLLLFGPPGTGKTMIAKAVATECKCTFFNISASSLTSKYLGESEKLVRTLFDLAHEMQPSVVFVDEIESILSKRKEDENDAMKRLKTEFLIQFDGVGSGEDLRVLIIGATNRPFDLDPAIIRRLPKRVYVGPFNVEERQGFIKTIITQNKCDIKDEEYKKIAEMCNNYSNSDLKELCREAAYEPLRELNVKSLKKVGELRPIVFDDFVKALRKVKGTLTKKILMELENWNKEFGALS
jgi:ATP-dependent 26S proteasome regulatory subunit